MSDTSSPKPNATPGDQKSPRETRLHEEVQYEQAELSVNGVVAVLAGIAIVFTGVFLICRWLLIANTSDADRAATAPNYTLPAEAKPTEPRLEPLDYSTAITANVFAGQLEKEHMLHTYGATSEGDYVHIPIEKAMKLSTEAIPPRQGGTEQPVKSFGLVGGGESNSGRKYSEAPSWLKQNK
jgi:hypothetical protein